jgi:hypothetical protein
LKISTVGTVENRKAELLKELLELSSRESSLHFKLATALEEARVETIRLSDMLSMCEVVGLRNEHLRREVEDLIRKYVIYIPEERR